MITINVLDSSTDYCGAVTVENWKFPAGEVGIRLNREIPTGPWVTVELTARLQNSDDVMELLMVNDAIPRKVYKKLTIGYMPYGRQDKKLPGESLSIRVMAGLINSMEFDEVCVFDEHSPLTSALIKNCRNISMVEILEEHNFGKAYDKNLIYVAPDLGAYKKVQAVAEAHRVTRVAYGMKTRDMRTGNITGYSLAGDEIKSTDTVVVLDDIVDGGGTFVLLGEEILKTGATNVQLYSTHGLYTKGIEHLKKFYSRIFCTDTYYPSYEYHTKYGNDISVMPVMSVF